MKIAVFASGNGSNFEVIVKSGINVDLLVVNKGDALVVNRAQNLGVKYILIENKDFSNKVKYEQEVVKYLKNYKIDLIFLAGYMLLVGETLLNEYSDKIINLHPSLLPKYKGLEAIKKAYLAKEQFIGITYHYIDLQMDEGTIIRQYKIKNEHDSLKQLEAAVHKLEHKTYPKVIKQLLKEHNEKSIN